MRNNANKWIRILFAVSVLSMTLSICSCIGSTFAWFQDSLSNENTIKIGAFNVRATISPADTKSATPLFASDTILSPGAYDLRVKGTGNTQGYALIFLEATTSNFRRDAYYTAQLNSSTEYTYRIMLHEPTAVRVTTVWGKMEGDDPLGKGEIIWYGRPPVVEKPEEAQLDGEAAAPPTEGKQSTPAADSAALTMPTDTPAVTGSAEETPSAVSEVEKTPAKIASAEKEPVSISVAEKSPAAMSVEKVHTVLEKVPVSVSVLEKAPATIETAEKTPTSATAESPLPSGTGPDNQGVSAH